MLLNVCWTCNFHSFLFYRVLVFVVQKLRPPVSGFVDLVIVPRNLRPDLRSLVFVFEGLSFCNTYSCSPVVNKYSHVETRERYSRSMLPQSCHPMVICNSKTSPVVVILRCFCNPAMLFELVSFPSLIKLSLVNIPQTLSNANICYRAIGTKYIHTSHN